jgi:hypothetical protein
MTRTFTALALAVLLTGCASKATYRTAQVAYVGSQVADVVSTQKALNAGAVETNPLMRGSLATQIAVKAATTVPVLWLSDRLERKGHRKVANAVLFSLATAYAVISGHNWQMAVKVTR